MLEGALVGVEDALAVVRAHHKVGRRGEEIPVGLSIKLNIALTILFYIWQLSYDT